MLSISLPYIVLFLPQTRNELVDGLYSGCYHGIWRRSRTFHTFLVSITPFYRSLRTSSILLLFSVSRFSTTTLVYQRRPLG